MTRPIEKVSEVNLGFEWTEYQDEAFHKATERYIIIPAGRQSGKTLGAVQYLIERCLQEENLFCLWVDVSYSQIMDLYENYFKKILMGLPTKLWKWKASSPPNLEFPVGKNIIRFRSADNPDTIVGSFYKVVILNEAGIQLLDHPTVWGQAVSKTLLKYSDHKVFFIGTPRGTIGKDGKENVYFSLYKKGNPNNPEYDKDYRAFQFSSYANNFLQKENIKLLEADPTITPLTQRQELYGEFVDNTKSVIFRPEWFQTTTSLPPVTEQYKRFITLDTAYSEKTSADESACCMWIKTTDGRYYLVDCWHDRLEFPRLLAKVRYTLQNFSADYMVVEDIGSGKSLVQNLRAELTKQKINVVSWDPKGPEASFLGKNDKTSRATAITGYLDRLMLYVYKAPWNFEYIGQHVVFPFGNHDDMVDCTTMALQWGQMNNPTKCTKNIFQMALPISQSLKPYKQHYMKAYSMPLNERLRGFN